MSYFCKLKSKSHRDRQAEWAVQEIERLRAENAELRKDAARLDFLVKTGLEIIQSLSGDFFLWGRFSGCRYSERDTARNAIDAAIKEST